MSAPSLESVPGRLVTPGSRDRTSAKEMEGHFRFFKCGFEAMEVILRRKSTAKGPYLRAN